MERKQMLHCLRNPYGIDEVEMRKARLQAADELERLYANEQQLKDYIESTLLLKNYIDEKQ